jgi:Cu/Ag efflux protein CusF
MGRDISILSLSIDPEVDTPDRLKRYWEALGSKPGWLYLTGDFDEIDRLRHELGVYDLDPIIDADKTQHSGIVTFGNDRTNRWAGLPALMHAEQMAATIARITWDGRWQRRRRVRRAADEPEPSRGRGVLRGVDAEKGEVVIEHDDIPGIMTAMTMSFGVADREMLEGLSPGQAVAFRVEHSDGRFRILEIGPRGQ